MGNTPLYVVTKQYYIMMTLCPGLRHVSHDESCAQKAQPVFSNRHINHLRVLQTELSSPYL